MNDCLHHNIHITWAAYRVDDPRDFGAVLRFIGLKANCQECGAPFRFMGNMPLAPENVVDALMGRGGAWVTPSADELGVMISPIEPGGVLESTPVAGRA